jgi:hypothetical protein
MKARTRSGPFVLIGWAAGWQKGRADTTASLTSLSCYVRIRARGGFRAGGSEGSGNQLPFAPAISELSQNGSFSISWNGRETGARLPG